MTREAWRPAPLILLSLLWHGVAAVTLLLRPEWWPWIVSGILANQLIVVAAVLSPRSRALGANLNRLPATAAARDEVCLTFDDGPDPQVTPEILAILDRYQVKASFFCIGVKVAAHPGLVKEIARRGHSVENHSHNHAHAFAFFGIARLQREVSTAQAIITAIAGSPPRYFRAPAGFRSPMLDFVLAGNSLQYASWTRRGYDATRSDPEQVLKRLQRGLTGGDVLLLHDGARTRTRTGCSVAVAVLPALLESIAAQGLKAVSLPAACGAPQATTHPLRYASSHH
jgi:peptidoglycan-N-acetylglucosamine deacetylase